MIGDRWGVTEAEVARRYPCDDYIASPRVQAWRGLSVAAPSATVWLWVAQIRLAPYSYDLIDNLGRCSPQQLKDLPPLVAGEPFTTVAGSRRIGRTLSVDPGVSLTGRISGAVISYVLVPEPAGTRLLMKICAAHGAALSPLLILGDLIMARRQLLNLKALSETTTTV